ncbi:hypothetical protein [Rhizobium sullae]|uniref:hypothetical protein n=1 Tax=Rhizobium sullae TaxID=50338 RepID=UPI000B35A2B9|nr:hypothetical protein [Rhizobium sullae]
MSDITTRQAEIGLQHLADKFADTQIDLDTLVLLSEQDLRELGVPLGPLAAGCSPRSLRSAGRCNPMGVTCRF